MSLLAQKAELRVICLDQLDSLPLENVLVRLTPAGRYGLSDAQGQYHFTSLAAGAYILEASLVGKRSWKKTLHMSEGESRQVTLYLADNSLELPEVQVTASEYRSVEGSTVSRIGRTAIEHVQPSSLRDVLQLVPGQLAINPSLAAPQQILLRQAGTDAAGNRAAQLGTAILLDGAPLSNNANLQTNVNILNQNPEAAAPFPSVADRGYDLRQIPADQIESVEVIRGIPSARYGDLTAGAVMINRRVGVFAPTARLRMNPDLMQVSAGAGFNLKHNRGVMSMDTDVSFGGTDPRDFLNLYSRWASVVGYSGQWFNRRLRNTTRLGFNTNLDRRRQEAGDPLQRVRKAEEWGILLNTQGSWEVNRTWLSQLQYNLNLTFTRQDSYFQEFIVTNVGPVNTATRDTTAVASYGSARYLNQTTIEGRPLNLYARLEGLTDLPVLRISHAWMYGAEYRLDANSGAGRKFDVTRPPRQNYSAGDRPRTFDDVPGLNQFSVYAEDRFRLPLFSRSWHWQLGLRYDHIFLTGGALSENRPARVGRVWSPRIYSSYELTPAIRIKGGYGIAAKAPTLAFLSPGPRFFDLINFNHFAQKPDERLVVTTTRRLEPNTRKIGPYTSRKWEGGFDYSWRGATGSLVVFREFTSGALAFAREAYVMPVARFGIVEQPAGAPPVLTAAPILFDTLFLGYDRPVNTRQVLSRGAEFNLELPEFKALRTTLNLSGAYYLTRSTEAADRVSYEFIFRTTNAEKIPVYPGGDGSEARQFNTTLRFIHRIPEAGLVVSWLTQVIWLQHDRNIGYRPEPVALIDKTGAYQPLSAEQAVSEEYAAYHRQISPEFFREERRPPLWLFNARLSKEYGKGKGFAFYVNNVLAQRPLYQSVRKGTFSQRNLTLFFGAEVFFSL